VYRSLLRHEQEGIASVVQYENLREQDQSRSLSKAQAGSRKEDAPRKIKISALQNVRPMTERVPLERAVGAYAKKMAGKAHFRMVLTI
jgi:hypothetical protein